MCVEVSIRGHVIDFGFGCSTSTQAVTTDRVSIPPAQHSSPSPCRGVHVPDVQQRAFDEHGQVDDAAGGDLLDVQVAAVYPVVRIRDGFD